MKCGFMLATHLTVHGKPHLLAAGVFFSLKKCTWHLQPHSTSFKLPHEHPWLRGENLKPTVALVRLGRIYRLANRFDYRYQLVCWRSIVANDPIPIFSSSEPGRTWQSIDIKRVSAITWLSDGQEAPCRTGSFLKVRPERELWIRQGQHSFGG